MSGNPIFDRKKASGSELVIPPQGDSDEDKAARVRFWLDRGDRLLAEAGKSHLHWCHANGHYWIEPR